MHRFAFLWLMSLPTGVWALPHPARADSAATEGAGASEEARKEASRHFRRGVELFQEQDYPGALVEFQRAYEIVPSYRLLYNIAQSQLYSRDYVAASQSYNRYLTEGGDNIAAEQRMEVESSLVWLSERVARLRILVNTDGAQVFVDGTRVGTSPLPTMVLTNVGRHRIHAQLPDGTVGDRTIDVAGGDSRTVSLELIARRAEGSSDGANAGLSRRKRSAIALWGVTAAAVVGAVTTGVMAGKKEDERNEELALKPPAGQASSERLADLGASADALAVTSDVLLGTAIAAGVTGLVLWLVDADPSEKKPTARDRSTTIRVRAGLGSFGIHGSF